MRIQSHHLATAVRWIILICCIVNTTGCAIHYYSEKTGTNHLIGFGHMKMKVTEPEEGAQAAIRGTQTLGASIGISKDDRHIGAGWSKRTRLEVLQESASVRFEWPTSNMFSIRVGTKPPFLKDDKEKEEDKQTKETDGETKQ